MALFKLTNVPIKSLAFATAIGFVACRFAISRLAVSKSSSRYIIIQCIEDWVEQEHEIIKTFSEANVIGIDCEWVTVDDKRNPVSLLQLADASGFCVLVRLPYISPWLIPTGLIELLRDEKVLKVGVGVSDDINKLLNDYGLEVQGFLDLRFLAKDLQEMQGKSLGLKSLASELLGVDLNKSRSLRCSDWDAEILSDKQVKYAADDAKIAAEIFEEIVKRKKGWFWGLDHKLSNEIKSYVDVPYKQSFFNTESKRNAGTNSLKKPHKSRYSMPRQKPMYDNCQLVAPDGELLCSCEKAKAEWYVVKGLGEKISDEPFTVRLNFEPSGRPTLDNVFYCKEKTNQCVVCGRTENFHRKNVVPSEYRKLFPNLMKKNLSHDVLLLCVHCHKKSNILDQQMRLKLADLCDAPLGSKKNIKYYYSPELAKVKSAATALFTAGDKIPEARQEILKKVITDFYGVPSVTAEILDEARNLDANMPNEAFIPHGLKVYQYFCENGGLIQFEKLWRQHFLDSMQPQFLPVMWSVEHNHKRLAIQVLNHEREVDFDDTILGLSPELIKEIQEN